MELAIKEVSFTRVLRSLKPGAVYAVPEGSYNLAGVCVSWREMYFSGQLPLRAGWWCRLFFPYVVGQELGRKRDRSISVQWEHKMCLKRAKKNTNIRRK